MTTAKNIKIKRKTKKKKYMYQTYILVTETYFQNTHSVASVTELDSTGVHMMVILLPITMTQESQGTSTNASTAFQKLSTKHKTKRKNEILVRNTYQSFLNFKLVEVLHKTT